MYNSDPETDIRFHDKTGTITLAEYKRLCALVAAERIHLRDLAVDFTDNDVTLHLEPDEFHSREALDLYEASFTAYNLWANRERESHYDDAITAYESMIEQTVEAIDEAAEKFAASIAPQLAGV